MSRSLDARLIRAVPRLRRMLAILAGTQLIGALLSVGQAVLLAELVTRIFLRHAQLAALLAPLALLAALGSARALLAGAQEWTTARASVRVRGELRRRVLESVLRLGPGWADRQPSGRLVTAAGPGLEGMDGYLTRALPAMVSAAVVPVVVLASIGVADWQSAVLLVVMLPLVPLFMALVGVTTRRRTQHQYALLARLSGQFLDLVQGLTTLKIYGQAHRQIDTVRRGTETYRRHALATLRMAFLSGLVLDLIATLSVAVVAVDIGLRLDHGELSLYTALVVLLLAPELFAPLRAVGAQHHAGEEGRAAAAAALDVPADSGEHGTRPGRLATASTGAITFRAATVRYPGRTAPALDELDLCIPPGQVLALRGRSGSGKSTVLSVLLRFAEPATGSVLAGTSTGSAQLSELDADSWRAQLAWVPQRPRPTQPNVAAEIALGDPQASAAQIADVIMACDAPGPDIQLGEDGAFVSAGQRRRIALARALLRARRQLSSGAVPVVLLDEPSEDLDEQTERAVATVVRGLAGRATVLIATHSDRLADVADRWVVLDQGQLSSDHANRPDPPNGPATVPAVAALPADAWPASELTRSIPIPIPAPRASPPASSDYEILPHGAPRRRLLAASGLSGAAGISGLALTATSIWLICRAAQLPNVQELALAVVGVRTFALARALLRYAERLLAHDGALRMLAEVRARVFAALEPLVPAGTASLRRGDLLRRFVSDVDGVQEGLVRAVVPLIGAVLTAGAAVALAGLLVPSAGLGLAAGLCLGLVGGPWLSRRIAGPGRRLAVAAARRDTRTAALLDGLAELTAYGAQQRSVAAVVRADGGVVSASARPALGAAAGVIMTGAASAVTMSAVLATGAVAAGRGALAPVTAGVLVACVLAGFDALTPLPAAFAAWARLRAGLRRVADLLATPVPIGEPAEPASVPSGVPAGATGLRAIGLRLAPAAEAALVLDGAALTVSPGDRIAIVGRSGSGKSTLLTAALRLLPLSGGRLDVRGGSVDIPLAHLRSTEVPPLVAGSLQGDHVFNASLRDNLLVVRPSASADEVDGVAQRVRLLDEIRAMPSGWSTSAGPDGSALSGGQRQRLLLARALLADPAVIVLDEPTAHLDPATEREVLADLLSATAGRTVLLSTHRALSPDQVDEVLRIEARQLTQSPWCG